MTAMYEGSACGEALYAATKGFQSWTHEGSQEEGKDK